LREHLRRLHAAGATGRLDYETGTRRSQLVVRKGELWLAPENPSAGEARRLLERPAEAEWTPLLVRMAERLLDAGSPRGVRFHEGDAQIPAGLVGPVPTAALLRIAARAAASVRPDEVLDTAAFDAPWVADERLGSSNDERARWSPEETWVLERLRQPMRLGELAADCPFPRRDLSLTLVGLSESGAIRSVSKAKEPAADSGLLRLRELLESRIEATLRQRPLTLSDAELREGARSLASSWPRLNHYELLSLSPSASEVDIQRAFESLARRVHPSHAERIGGEAGMSLVILFERAVAAFRTLNDPAMRVAYNAAHAISVDLDERSEETRLADAARLARSEFERARYEELNGDLHTALSLYELAAGIDPRAEYLCALGALQAKNKAWVTRAIETYRHALELDPESPEIRFALGELHERRGDIDRARSFYQAAQNGRPPHPGAKAALRRVGPGRGADGEGGLGRFFRRG